MISYTSYMTFWVGGRVGEGEVAQGEELRRETGLERRSRRGRASAKAERAADRRSRCVACNICGPQFPCG